MELATPADISKLTVPQLKLLCKERKITGYSKLGKTALVQKLLDTAGGNVAKTASSIEKSSAIHAQAASGSVSPTSGQIPGGSKDTPITARDGAKKTKTVAPSLRASPSTNVKNIISEVVPAPENDLPPASTKGVSLAEIHAPARSVSHLKRPLDTQSHNRQLPSQKRQHIGALEPSSASIVVHGPHTPEFVTPGNPLSAPSVPQFAQNSSGRVPAPSATPKSLLPRQDASAVTRSLKAPATLPGSTKNSTAPSAQTPVSKTRTSDVASSILPNAILPPRRLPVHEHVYKVTENLQERLLPPSIRFKPLKVTAQLQSSVIPKSVLPPVHLDPAPLYSLDFPLVGLAPTFSTITMPPSKTQRKFVKCFSVLLGGLSDADRRQCILGSRMLRYAVYLSAVPLLQQNFSGRRLSRLLMDHSVQTTNMWPYLRQRQNELSVRMEGYAKSFLARFLGSFNPVAQRLWSSPDNAKQIIVALRFVLTRLWFLLSVGGGKDSSTWSRSIVTDAREIVEGEIWVITVRFATRTETCYVIESTCEVLGHPAPPATLSPTSDANEGGYIPLRADWKSYIEHRVSSHSAREAPSSRLLDQLKWTNYEEYDRGISKLWLKRIGFEGELGVAKGIVAERYVLACVVGNSLSGRWMTSLQMAQDFAGLPGETTGGSRQEARVNLFLPALHHVESVHFTASDGRPLHPAVAVVQTLAREYFILRDNGMQVGCEEEGVSDVWRGVLGCSRSGTAH